jgi:hypothetical protein
MKNRILVAIVPVLACFALLPGAQAVSPAPDGCYPNFTTAEGCKALQNLVGGAGNTGFGWYSLFSDVEGSFNTGVGGGALVLNTGDSNTAVGAAAGLLNTSGTLNTAVGTDAMVFNDTGDDNTGVGAFALENNVSGVTNAALGTFAAQNSTASFNVAVGGFALRDNTGGARNTAVGAGAMEAADGGDDNTAIGDLAGNALGGGNKNICIGSGVVGVADENNNIRVGTNLPSGGIAVVNNSPLANAVTIGPGTSTEGITILTVLGFGTVSIGNGLQTTNGASTCLVGGIFNQTPTAGSHAVVVGPDNKLADATLSSRRFKKDIAPIDKLSEGVLALKPVTFHWKTDKTNEPEFGLIAEEVAKVNLDWITRNPQGEVTGVRYDTIPILLLNEFLKEHKKVEEQQANISQLKSEMQTMVAQLKEQAAQIQKVSAQLEVGKPAAKVVVNKP